MFLTIFVLSSTKINCQVGENLSANAKTTTLYKQFKASLIAYTTLGLSLADGNTTVYDSAFSNNVDNDDVIKIRNFGENCGIFRNDDTLAIEARQPIVNADTIFFKIWNLKQQQYKLQFVPKNMNISGLTAKLQDNFLAKDTPVSIIDTSNYDFTVTSNPASYASDRFKIVFKISAILPLTFTSFHAEKHQKNVNVEWKIANEKNIKIFQVERSTNGRDFEQIGNKRLNENTSINTFNFTDNSPFNGDNYYRIRALEYSGVSYYSSTEKINFRQEKINFSVNPNPVINNFFNLQLDNQPKGNYLLRLTNEGGQVIYFKSIENLEDNFKKTINLPYNLKTGTYQLEIFWPNGLDKKVQKIIIKNN